MDCRPGVRTSDPSRWLRGTPLGGAGDGGGETQLLRRENPGKPRENPWKTQENLGKPRACLRHVQNGIHLQGGGA